MAASSSVDKVSLNTFPSCKQEALAIAYVQAQDLSGKTPEELAAMYDDAYSRICDAFKNMFKEEKEQRRKENPHTNFF